MTHLTQTVLNPTRVAYLCAVVFVAALLCVLACRNPAFSQQNDAGQTPDTPQLLILVWHGQGWTDLVNVSYDSEVEKDTLMQDINAFARQLGWSVNNIQINTKKIPVPGSRPATSATFETTTQLGGANGAINIEPIVLAFKRFDTVQINYLSSQDMTLFAPHGYEDKQVSIKSELSPGNYQYLVSIKDHNIKRLNWPKGNSAPTDQQSNTQSSRKRGNFGVTLLIALAGAVCAYFITKKITTKV